MGYHVSFQGPAGDERRPHTEGGGRARHRTGHSLESKKPCHMPFPSASGRGDPGTCSQGHLLSPSGPLSLRRCERGEKLGEPGEVWRGLGMWRPRAVVQGAAAWPRFHTVSSKKPGLGPGDSPPIPRKLAESKSGSRGGRQTRTWGTGPLPKSSCSPQRPCPSTVPVSVVWR